MAGKGDTDLTRRGFLRGGLGATAGVLVGGGAASAGADETAASVPAPPAPAAEAAPAVPPGLDRVVVHTSVNGQAQEFEVPGDESALLAIRDRLGICGPKSGCGRGVCGACVSLLDGEPVATCVLPATSLEGRSVQTIESFGPELHPIQKAFVAEDALQCGFCTPGFVVEAIAFYDRWRAEHGTAEPDRGTVAQALSGHLCRCGAYASIFRAVQGACAGRFEGEGDHGPRHDAKEKVQGRAIYTSDVRLDGQLEARVVRSPHAHAVVKTVDSRAAEALPGVQAVVLLTELGGVVRFPGQEIAAVAAVDRHTAEQARRLIQVDYDVLPSTLGMDAGRSPDSEAVYPGPVRHPAFANEGVEIPAPWCHNTRGPFGMFTAQGTKARALVKKARASQAAEDSGSGGMSLADGTYTTQVQCHNALEPHCCVARWEADGGLSVWLSTQACSDMAQDIATRWKLPRRTVRVLCPYVGGAFGAKATMGMEVVAAVELARACGAPVRVVLDRSEELLVGGFRPGVEMNVGLCASAPGTLAAMDVVSFNDAGTAVGSNVGVFFRLMYPASAKSLVDWDVVTHAPPGKPFRGPGGPPAFFALEQSVDEVAFQRGEDPLALRRRWDVHKIRQHLYGWVETLPLWTDRGSVASDRGRFRRGVGLAAGTWFHFVGAHAQVQVSSAPDGFVVSCGTQDMGNGTRSSLAAGVSEVLGVPASDIEVRIGDSDFVQGPLSAGSRTTCTVVPAAIQAASSLRDDLLAHAVRQFSLQDAKAGSGGIDHAQGHLPWSQVLASAPPLSSLGRRPRDDGGYFFPFSLAGIHVGKALTAIVTVMEVEVDSRLGRVRPVEVFAGLAAGRIVLPHLARSQVEGALIQGLSYSLYEERRMDPQTGRLLSGGLESYRIAGVGDTPKLHVHFEERGFDHVEGRILGLSELATVTVAATVGNAVHHATGWRPRHLPLRCDRVVEGLKA